ncbi:MAG: hypothetical protein KDK99_13345 [Verrucomicrobiales bacterium]|nr:hypothetical protein [Verrucomicrobiales bacterium]
MIRSLDRWLPAWLTRDRAMRGPQNGPWQVFIAVCDHFEPFHGTDKAGALAAIRQWEQRWPPMVKAFCDASGRGPRHTFFYPVEQYDDEIIERLAALCERTGSEVEVHLHHDSDTAASLKQKLRKGLDDLARHGLLSRNVSGAPRFGFIHGNWALDHSHPTGCHCGVPDELRVLKATGCYADFTMPAAPDPSQTRTINSIYYAKEDGLPKSHDRGVAVECGKTARLADDPDHLLMVQGPLGLNWRWRKHGVLPRIENGDLTTANPPTAVRYRLWTQICPAVKGGGPWIFVKLHTHGGIARNYDMLLGDAMRAFHKLLGLKREFQCNYVTAREMANLVHAAEDGAQGEPGPWLDHVHAPPPRLDRGGEIG